MMACDVSPVAMFLSSVVNYLRIKEEFGVLENSLLSVPSLFSIGKVKHKKVLSI